MMSGRLMTEGMTLREEFRHYFFKKLNVDRTHHSKDFSDADAIQFTGGGGILEFQIGSVCDCVDS
jgi:hypothetical protein